MSDLRKTHEAEKTPNARLQKVSFFSAKPIFMIRTLLLILFCICNGISYAQFKQNDTLFFVRDSSESYYHKVFIDTNKNSEFYSYVADFTFTQFDVDTYKSSLNYLYSKKLFPHKQTYNNFPLEWTMLETYKGETYVYSPADYYNHYKIRLTDSLFIDFSGEGPEATYIEKFKKIDSSTFQFILKSVSYPKRVLTIRYIDKGKGIAVFQDKFYSSDLKRITLRWIFHSKFTSISAQSLPPEGRC